MKRSLQIMVIIVFVLLVGQLAGFYSGAGTLSRKYSETSKTRSDIHFLNEVLPPANTFADKEGNTFVFSSCGFSISSNKLKDYKALLHHANVQAKLSFSEFVLRAKNFTVHIRSKELLFPFHYFLESITR